MTETIDRAERDRVIETLSVIVLEEASNKARRMAHEVALEADKVTGGGVVYDWGRHEFTTLTGGSLVRAVHVPLPDQALALAQEWNREAGYVREDWERLRMGFLILFKDCESLQDFRDGVPEDLARRWADLSALPRTRPAGWSVAGKGRPEREFEKLRSVISLHSMARLVE